MSKSRSFCFTLNNYTDEQYESICALESVAQYLIVGREVGDSGTPHLQGYIRFKNPRSFNAVRELIPQAHVEVAKGSPASNMEYCSKEGNFVEFGTAPVERGKAEKKRWADSKAMMQSGVLDELDPDIFIRYYSTAKRIAQDAYVCPPTIEGELEHWWFYGDPGTGKSRFAREQWPGAYIKNTNKWWCGYQAEETVIMDEIELEHGKFIGHFLKIWGDRYPFKAEVKGGGKNIRPLRIVVTSNYTIDEVFAHDTMLAKAIKRRFKSKHFALL